MAILSWRARRQFIVFGSIGALFLVIVGLAFFGARSAPTCFDSRQNQNEEGVDCGGECAPCLENLSLPIVLWARSFALSSGVYETAALVENLHTVAAADRAFYRVKLYDESNILIAQREGETYINPAERFLVLEPGIQTGERIPVRTVVEFESVRWRYADYRKPNVLVTRRDFTLDSRPRLSVRVRNAGTETYADLQASVVLVDASGNAYAASQTTIGELQGDVEETLSFSWPAGSVAAEPAAIEILVRIPAPR